MKPLQVGSEVAGQIMHELLDAGGVVVQMGLLYRITNGELQVFADGAWGQSALFVSDVVNRRATIHVLPDEFLSPELAAAREEIAALKAQMEAAKERFLNTLMGDAECKRVDRWHATYNAALSGLYAINESGFGAEKCHEWCVAAADLAHGPIGSRTSGKKEGE